MTVKNDIYEDLLLEVDNDGKFQKYFNFKYNVLFLFFGSMAYFNYVYLLAVPEHSCFVPGRNETNLTLEMWKTRHIPRSNNEFSRCTMYVQEDNQTNISNCLYGIEYDKTWFEKTVPSEQNWVCEEDMKVTHGFVIGRLGEIIGTFLLGSIGDKFGRKPCFFICLLTLTLGRLSCLFTSSIYPLFALSLLVGSLSSNVIFQAVLIIGFEISKDEKRSAYTFYQCAAWTVGLCTLPLIYWYFKTWVPYLLITTLPLVTFFVFRGYLIESPRWLANRGKKERCLEELSHICKVNKTSISEITRNKFRYQKNIEEKELNNMLILFTNKIIAKMSILSMIGWSCWNMVYVIIYLNVTNLHGNPHMNFFWQSFAELPGYFIGKYSSDYLGRKISRLLAFALNALGCLLILLFISKPDYDLVVAIISVFLKLTISMVYYVTSLHTLEIFPTNVRQSGSSLGFLAGNVASLLAPYVVHMGVTINSKIPYIVSAFLGLVAATSTLWLPETLHQKLPETIDEIDELNKQKMLFLPKYKNIEVAN